MSTKKQARLKAMGLGAEKPRISVVQALETAVLLLEQGGYSEDEIMRLVHLIHLGLIRDGQLTEEYLKLASEAQQAREQLAQIPDEELDRADRQWERDRRQREIAEAIGQAVDNAQAPTQVIDTSLAAGLLK